MPRNLGASVSGRAIVRRVALKEITLFFTSPVAYLFLGSFAAITLFVFFWGEAFFARNIADVRPMFEWMPVLLIFLCATLTMRLWSEERRTGTLEFLLTRGVPVYHFVLGKFLGCLFLLILALLITLPLPVTVANLGDLDWGPVLGGYIAAVLMGAAYLSIGLFVSARSDNQIVSLISAVALGGVFYLVGNAAITDFFGTRVGEALRLLGSGARFDSITRGVLDARDLVYYLSITAAFLALNTYVLERERWAHTVRSESHRRWGVVTALFIANVLAANLWFGQITWLRHDVTEGQQYSISEATQGYLDQLREPLLLRGYFSAQTHPLLAPLVPQVRDLLREYEVAGNGKVRVEVVDPQSDPQLEEEANQKFGIRPVPFQVADRYQSSIVSSYFNVLLQYGDETQVLGFDDLIEVKASAPAQIEVQLRNPEHDITRAIKQVLRNYQAAGNLFDTLGGELQFNGYVSSSQTLPEALADFRKEIDPVLERFQLQSAGRLSVDFVDPGPADSEVGVRLAQDYGFRPMATSLFTGDTFYFYMTLSQGETVIQIPLDDMTADSFERNLEAAIKRFSTGFTRTVALVAPEGMPMAGPHGAPGLRFSQLEAFLGAELNVQREDLSDGAVSGDADALLLLAPENLDQTQLWAVDQFLMQGGTVIASTSPYTASISRGGLTLAPRSSGLADWLEHHGLKIEPSVVLDPVNTALPVPVTRNLGGFRVQEMVMLDYPYLPDVRSEGLNQDNLITSNLPQLSLAWASPITVSNEESDQEIVELVRSSNGSWLSSSLDIAPRVDQRGGPAYAPQGEQRSRLLGVISQGRFNSYFQDKEPPTVSTGGEPTAPGEEVTETNEGEGAEPQLSIASVIERSPESARIILFSSNDFLSDQVMGLISGGQQREFLSNLQFAANAIDWSLEDSGLLAIRSRGHFNRTLNPSDRDTQALWEYGNYGLAVLAILVVALIERRYRSYRLRKQLTVLAA